MYVELACVHHAGTSHLDEAVRSIDTSATVRPGAGVHGRALSRGARHRDQCRRTRFWVSRAIFFRCRLTAAAFLRLRTVVGFS